MGERNFYLRYEASRCYADVQAERFKDGGEVEGWTYETEWIPGTPEPPKITMTGGAWVAHAYTIAGEDAEILASRNKEWQCVVDECKELAKEFQEKTQNDGPECKYCGELNCTCQEWMLLP